MTDTINNFASDFQSQMREISSAFDSFRERSDGAGDALHKMSNQGLAVLSKTLAETTARTKDYRSALKQLAQGLLHDLAGYVFKSAPPKEAAGLPGYVGGFSFRAKGGVTAPGSAYVVGEKGPELLFTGRTAGFVAPGGAGGSASPVSITVINNSSAKVHTQESRDGNGGRDILFQIDDMVAKTLSEPDSRSSKVLRSRFGLNPSLTQR